MVAISQHKVVYRSGFPPYLGVIILVAGYGVGWIASDKQQSVDPRLLSSSCSNRATERPQQDKRNPLQDIFDKRPNWKTDFELSKWLPRWLPQKTVKEWESFRHNNTHLNFLYNDARPQTDEEDKLRDDYFWQHLNHMTSSWATHNSTPFSIAEADNGFGHRLAHLSLSYMCNVVPNQRQLIVNWFDPANEDNNRMWHALFEDTPVLAGLPKYWEQGEGINKANAYRKLTGTQSELRFDEDLLEQGGDVEAGDYHMYFDRNTAGAHCPSWSQLRDLWLLRLAKEPSVQEFYQLLRAQIRQKTKDKIAEFIESFFPKDKIVVGVHIRSGNGKDDGAEHFDDVSRGDWLKDLPAAIRMVRKHLRMVAYSMTERNNAGSISGLDFNKDEFDEEMDGAFRIFLATDSASVIEEFRRQHPNVLTLEQERVAPGEGVAIFETVECDDKNRFDCQVATQEAMLMDAYILSSCDATVAESYSNFMYTIPASIMMAEGRAFCESGRSALGGKYILGGDHGKPNTFGEARWWKHPPSDAMPVRCHQGGWAARDRADFHLVRDVQDK